MSNLALIDEVYNDHSKRVERFSSWKRRTREMADYVKDSDDPRAESKAQRLHDCHDWLMFRHYYQLGKIRLGRTSSCRMHLLCPMCAIQRAAAAVQRYHERYEVVTEGKPHRLYYAVLTAPNGDSLTERFTHVETAVRGLVGRRRDALRAIGGSKRHEYARDSQFASIGGGAYSFEVHRGKGSGLWHPHVNVLMLSREGIDERAFIQEWTEMTGDSKAGGQYCREVDPDSKAAFVEVFKYALKFNAMSIFDTFQAYRGLTRRRLVGSFGSLYGVHVPDQPDDEVLASPYTEIVYQYARRMYQRVPSDGSMHTMPLSSATVVNA